MVAVVVPSPASLEAFWRLLDHLGAEVFVLVFELDLLTTVTPSLVTVGSRRTFEDDDAAEGRAVTLTAWVRSRASVL